MWLSALLTSFDVMSTIWIMRSYGMRVGPITPSTPLTLGETTRWWEEAVNDEVGHISLPAGTYNASGQQVRGVGTIIRRRNPIGAVPFSPR